MLQPIRGSQSAVPDVSVSRKVSDRTINSAFQSFIEEAMLDKTQKHPAVTFSSHAQKRLDQHGFQLNQQDLNRLEEAVETLESKGSKQSLILYDDLALIASIKNRTVITALKSDEMNEVTNIDSVIHINQKR
ncbi:putative flagellar hook associated protein [Alkalibacterium sp. AK22]|uniref:TIGR02530 family flagellar biosynthesis protein n=1 Tax=Alkalibacterium sp. AK22 TaxID=1229520 RepID=UPI000448BECA|nr:TIGR02530 family flagellar biosynthesis protein [Alkalibacterium sp. AK22]EXJ22388.1 putative flagellar hook associated protein [Alkalibacterium sp. AK22]